MVAITEIIEKRGILYSLAPFSDGVKSLKRKSDLTDFAYTDLKQYGSLLTKEGAKSILAGNTIPGVPVFEHRLCEAHRKLLSRFEADLDMKNDVDTIVLNRFCTILAGTDLPPFREGSPLLYHLDFVPGDDNSISADLAQAFTGIRRAEKAGVFSGDFCLKAASMHMAILKVYPYAGGFSELAARAAMQYELMRAGYFPVDIGLSEPDYNTICANALRSGDSEEFAGHLRAAVYKKLHMLIDAVERGI